MYRYHTLLLTALLLGACSGDGAVPPATNEPNQTDVAGNTAGANPVTPGPPRTPAPTPDPAATSKAAPGPVTYATSEDMQNGLAKYGYLTLGQDIKDNIQPLAKGQPLRIVLKSIVPASTTKSFLVQYSSNALAAVSPLCKADVGVVKEDMFYACILPLTTENVEFYAKETGDLHLRVCESSSETLASCEKPVFNVILNIRSK